MCKRKEQKKVTLQFILLVAHCAPVWQKDKEIWIAAYHLHSNPHEPTVSKFNPMNIGKQEFNGSYAYIQRYTYPCPKSLVSE